MPPRDAAATAQRVADAAAAASSSNSSSSGSGSGSGSESPPLYFADLNAVAPSTVKSIAALFERNPGAAGVRFVDGSIIGGPPAIRSVDGAGDGKEGWSVPSIPTSGPHKLSDIPGYGEKLFGVLNMRHIGPEVGSASGLKSKFDFLFLFLLHCTPFLLFSCIFYVYPYFAVTYIKYDPVA